MSSRREFTHAAPLANLDAAAPDLDRRQAVESYRQVLASERQSLTDRYHDGVAASVLVHQSATFIDALLAKAWCAHDLPMDKNLALIAVGGYGRGELHPGSDVDLLVLVDKERDHSG